MGINLLKEKDSDLSVQTFLVLRDEFFDSRGQSRSFRLRAKLSTQDDPLDEYLHKLLDTKLGCECTKASPLVSPDLVLYRKEKISRDSLEKGECLDLAKILAIEVKKLNRTSSGLVARRSGLDYNTTPPCGKVRVYDEKDKPLDIRAFYLFVCQEETGTDNRYELSAVTLCDGNALNMDFDLYLSAVKPREKQIKLGTYLDGLNRNRPMFVFANPLGLPELDRHATLIHPACDLERKCRQLSKTHRLLRPTEEGGHMFYCYRLLGDVSPSKPVGELANFPSPLRRTERTQQRGRLRLPITI